MPTTYTWDASSNLTVAYQPGDILQIANTSAADLDLALQAGKIVLTGAHGTLTLTSATATLADLAKLQFKFADHSLLLYVNGGLSANGSGNNDLLVGDHLSGNFGNDKLYATDGTAYLGAGRGDDTLVGGGGTSYLYGDLGNDHYVVNSRTTLITDTDGLGSVQVNADWYKPSPDLTSYSYAAGVQALPYWIDSLTDADASLLAAGAKHVVYYTFPQAPPLTAPAADSTGYQPFTADQIAYTRKALDYISSMFDVQFVEGTDPNLPYTIDFGNNVQKGSSGYAYELAAAYPSGVLVNIDKNAQAPSNDNGDLLYYVIMHEIGHTLGLKHTFAVNSIDGAAETGPFLPKAEDSDLWSVMSYTQLDENRGMHYAAFDIAALDYIWGPAKTDHAGDTTWTLQADQANFIHDGDGVNSIDGSALTQPLTLTLEAGYWSYIGAKSDLISSAGQVTIDFGTAIRDARGGAGNDTIKGNALNNQLSGGGGADTLDGAGGIDTAVYRGPKANYTITLGDQGATVTDKTGADGADALTNIERLHFSDGDIALDINGSGGDIYRLYQAAFNRQPDAAGLGYWIAQRDAGADMHGIAQGFMGSKEYTDLYGANPDNTAFLTHTYDNVLHRAYDQGGFDYWLDTLNKGVSRDDVLLAFADSAENRAQVIGSIDHGIAFTAYA
jgi:hypothetical protein